jgi:COX assembly protein 1
MEWEPNENKPLPFTPKHTTNFIDNLEFAACAVNRTVTATWICRKQRLAMNSCMVAHAKPEEEDRAREEWWAGRDERRRARIKEEKDKEERRAQIIQMMREDAERQRQEKEKGKS